MDATIKLIMVDMGGVLAFHTDCVMERKLLEEFGVKGYLSFAALDPTLPALLQQHSKNLISEQQLWEIFEHKTGIIVPKQESSLWGKYFEPTINPAVEGILRDLKKAGYRIICATNTEPAHYERHTMLRHYAIFDAVYASCVIGKAKPELEFFQYILQQEGIKPYDALFIDDYQENCEAASLLGINAYRFEDPVDLRWELFTIGLLK